MKTYHARSGGLWVKDNEEKDHLLLGGSYIADRIILEGQLHPSKNDNWDEYKNWRILIGCNASVNQEKTITVHSEYGDFKFILNAHNRYVPDASKIGFQKSKTQSAYFFDFSKRFDSSYDISRVTY